MPCLTLHVLLAFLPPYLQRIRACEERQHISGEPRRFAKRRGTDSLAGCVSCLSWRLELRSIQDLGSCGPPYRIQSPSKSKSASQNTRPEPKYRTKERVLFVFFIFLLAFRFWKCIYFGMHFGLQRVFYSVWGPHDRQGSFTASLQSMSASVPSQPEKSPSPKGFLPELLLHGATTTCTNTQNCPTASCMQTLEKIALSSLAHMSNGSFRRTRQKQKGATLV